MNSVSFPPLFSGMEVPEADDPFDVACQEARLGCDAGRVAYSLGANKMRAAIVFAPEVPLREAMAMLPVCGIGFQNALGALAPPEVGVHLAWDGGIEINGGRCGKLRAAAAQDDQKSEPDWLVVGIELTLWPEGDDPGKTPDQTALYAEGCADVEVPQLLEAWVRHSLVWINRWSDEGVTPVHKEWTGLASGLGDSIEVFGQTGKYLGVDEQLGMLFQRDGKTELIPLTRLLET